MVFCVFYDGLDDDNCMSIIMPICEEVENNWNCSNLYIMVKPVSQYIDKYILVYI